MSDCVVEVHQPEGTVTLVLTIGDSVETTELVLAPSSVVVQTTDSTTLEVTGPEQGPAGASGLDATRVLRADTNLSGHRVVKPLPSGDVAYADHTELGDATSPLWLTLGAAVAGDLVEVRLFGEVEEPSWSWTPGLPVFLGTVGLLTQTPPSTGLLVMVANAPTPTSVFWGPRPPIVLS